MSIDPFETRGILQTAREIEEHIHNIDFSKPCNVVGVSKRLADLGNSALRLLEAVNRQLRRTDPLIDHDEREERALRERAFQLGLTLGIVIKCSKIVQKAAENHQPPLHF